MTEKLTVDDLKVLQAPFEGKDHKFVKGSGGKLFAYIDEDPIMTRIESVDPTADWVIDGITHRKDGDTHTCSVWGRLIIKGRTCSGMGSASVALKTYETQNKGVVVSEANEAEKSAATDALKRAARLFGIGRYLLSCPDYVNDARSLDEWVAKSNPVPENKTGASGDVTRLGSTSPEGAIEPNGKRDKNPLKEAHWTKNGLKRTQFVQWAMGEYPGLQESEILDALEVDDLTKFQGDQFTAMGMFYSYAEGRNAVGIENAIMQSDSFQKEETKKEIIAIALKHTDKVLSAMNKVEM